MSLPSKINKADNKHCIVINLLSFVLILFKLDYMDAGCAGFCAIMSSDYKVYNSYLTFLETQTKNIIMIR